MSLAISIEEASSQLHEAGGRVARIRAKIDELTMAASNAGQAVSQGERQMAEAILAGEPVPDEPISMVSAPMNPVQLRKALGGLESLLASALDAQSQAKAALRVARVNELKALLAEQQAEFDEQARSLLHRWAVVSALGGRLAAITRMSQYGPIWGQMKIPRAIPGKPHSPYETQHEWHASTEEILSGHLGNPGRNEAAAKLRERGIE